MEEHQIKNYSMSVKVSLKTIVKCSKKTVHNYVRISLYDHFHFSVYQLAICDKVWFHSLHLLIKIVAGKINIDKFGEAYVIRKLGHFLRESVP